MRLLEPLAELRDRLRGYPRWVLVLAAPLYPLVFFGCLICLPLLLPNWILGPLLGPLVAPIGRSCAVQWLSTKKVEDFPVYVAELAGLFHWDVARAADLLQRIRVVRRILLLIIGGQWVALLATGVIVGVSFALREPPDLVGLAVIACGAILVVSTVFSASGLSYYHGLYKSWQTLQTALCGQCGYIREHVQSLRCPECGTGEPAVPPGRAPRCRDVWSPLVNKWTTGLPLSLLCCMFLFDRLVLDACLSAKTHGWVVLMMTGSAAGVILWVLWVFWFRWKRAWSRSPGDKRGACVESDGTGW